MHFGASGVGGSPKGAGGCVRARTPPDLVLIPEKRAVEGADGSQERGREQEQVAVLADPPPVADRDSAPPVTVAVVPERGVTVGCGLPRAVEARDRVAGVRGEPEILA